MSLQHQFSFLPFSLLVSLPPSLFLFPSFSPSLSLSIPPSLSLSFSVSLFVSLSLSLSLSPSLSLARSVCSRLCVCPVRTSHGGPGAERAGIPQATHGSARVRDEQCHSG